YNLIDGNEYVLVDVNDQRDQTNPTNEQHTRISNTVLSHSEAVENRENVSIPLEVAQQTIEGATCLTPILHQKQTHPTGLTTKSS
ncbi:unnamed protein product, partial [Rotaria sordida]